MSVSIKISEENYRNLSALSGRLREKFHKPVSLNDAISFLYRKGKLSDLAGSWEMEDTEATKILSDLEKRWKIRSDYSVKTNNAKDFGKIEGLHLEP